MAKALEVPIMPDARQDLLTNRADEARPPLAHQIPPLGHQKFFLGVEIWGAAS
jgi:hypothetical protein